MRLDELMAKSRGEIENHSRGMAKAFQMNEKLCCRLLGGPIMFCDPSNNDFTPWIGLEGHWESWITMAIGRALQPGWVCYDVGAAWGYYSLIMGWAGASKVVAVEPNQERADFVSLNMSTNYHHVPFEMAVTALNDGKSDTCNIEVIPGRVCGFPSIKNISFPAVDFDSLCQKLTGGKVDFMKVDIDGGELLFWKGVQDTISKNRNLIIVMEVNANRYDARTFYQSIQAVFPIFRIVTTDGVTRTIELDELIQESTKDDVMLWLQG